MIVPLRANARTLAADGRKRMRAMSALTMDTDRIVKRLKDAGFTDSQAETLTDVIGETHASDMADVKLLP
jgi:hypothetical protein